VAYEVLHAFIDDAGGRSMAPKSSDHFVMGAVILTEAHSLAMTDTLAHLRKDLRRRPGDLLHWHNIRSHPQRLHIARTIGACSWMKVSAVVVCKRHLARSLPTEDHAYLYTLRFLLERLSWHAHERHAVLGYTLAHIVRFELKKLRRYEAALRVDPECRVKWAALDPRGGGIDQPSRVEGLQLADLATSAIYPLSRVRAGRVRQHRAPVPARDRRPALPAAPGALTSYGLTVHPWNEQTRAAYPWVAAL
jgi:hypothetical protein